MHEMQTELGRPGNRPPLASGDAPIGHQGGPRGADGAKRGRRLWRKRAQRLPVAGGLRQRRAECAAREADSGAPSLTPSSASGG
ncbi:hypothetical protein ebA3233 [Aromatoleum aromaticum EbN1]|uniref:Uncharacterized protein n=1 Tax=Aromatoleum aromaticum (strain DSM 19018 / LMG 30748 / EbN1) TaxID=76114 RepID=Q5P418_AROAE|nr:hypothetical protein ebA3233 [Aromatoleum aromaticum EbN1]